MNTQKKSAINLIQSQQPVRQQSPEEWLAGTGKQYAAEVSIKDGKMLAPLHVMLAYAGSLGLAPEGC